MINPALLHGSDKDLMEVEGYVTEVERYAIHDGYGLRTVVFLKGCPLRCKWCSNPETQIFSPEMGYFKGECIGCGRCATACPYNSIDIGKGSFAANPAICMAHCVGKAESFPCVAACPGTARRIYGEKRTVWSLYGDVSRDAAFYERDTGGGLTISGGEPMSQPEMTYALLRYCSEHWIDTAIETSGVGEPEDYREIASYLNFAFIDIKSLDPDCHMEWTGRDNQKILANVRLMGTLATEYGFELVVRIPIIPSFNDRVKDITSIAAFLGECQGISGVELLPYHRLGRGKYESLSRDYALPEKIAPDEDSMASLRQVLADHKIPNLSF